MTGERRTRAARAILFLCSLSALASGTGARQQADDILINDFEARDYGEWKVTGTAFGPGPARGTLKGQMAVSGFKGQGLVNTFFDGDTTTGTLTSPEFAIQRKHIAFLIGGGKDPEKLTFQLLVDGKVVRSATGPNDRPGGSEELAPDSWDFGEIMGKRAVLKITDNATGPWGHINVDHIRQTDRKPAGDVKEPRREFLVESRYLNLPIKNGGRSRVVTLLVEGKPVVRNDIELADDQPDWWAPMDVSMWRGKKVAVMVDRLREDSSALKNIEPGDTIKGGEKLYREPLRGQLHFSPRRGWNNDPNGMVYHNGEYHLFFQHNPYGWNWGNMHWGHAVSKDMVHWEDLGDKLLPDTFGPMFSGSAVVDHGNTSGFGKDGKPPIVLIYTAAGNPTVQCIAHSTDGRTFTKYDKNPVIKQVTGGNRDPKVLWHAPTRKWVLVLYVSLRGRHTIHFYTSPNLREWELASVFDGGTDGKDGYLYECPDFFELPVDGDASNRKWVLLGANSEYAIGSFDGVKFTPEFSRLAGNQGRGFYAPQTFSDIPASDGRRIQIGWFQTGTPGMPFNQSMTVPQELRLVSSPAGPRLARIPVKELESLRAETHAMESFTLKPGADNPLARVKAETLELRAEFEPAREGGATFILRGIPVEYDAKKQELSVNGHRVSVPLEEGRVRLLAFVDRTGLEVFASGGKVYVPMPVNLRADDQSFRVTATGGEASFRSLSAHQLRSIWKTK